MLAGNIDKLKVYFCPVMKKRDTKNKAADVTEMS